MQSSDPTRRPASGEAIEVQSRHSNIFEMKIYIPIFCLVLLNRCGTLRLLLRQNMYPADQL
jgi:hypothetical protein